MLLVQALLELILLLLLFTELQSLGFFLILCRLIHETHDTSELARRLPVLECDKPNDDEVAQVPKKD